MPGGRATDIAVTRRIALAHVIPAYPLSVGSCVAPFVLDLELQTAVALPIYGGAIALFLQVVGTVIAGYAIRHAPDDIARTYCRRVRRYGLAGCLLAPILTFVALYAISSSR